MNFIWLIKTKKDFLKNPRTVSNYMLYGNYSDMPNSKIDTDFMKPIYEILDKYKGKVIYLDFLDYIMPPCLKEMEPLKKLRKEYSPGDVVIVSICAGGPKKTWEDLVKRLDLQQPGIDCLYQTDISDENSFYKILNRLELKRLPLIICYSIGKGSLWIMGQWYVPVIREPNRK